LLKPFEGPLAAPVAVHIKRPAPGHPHLDLVAFLEFERLGDLGRDADRQAVALFRDAHTVLH